MFPELVLDLLCQGPIEKGLDASNGGVEFYTFGVDGAALATAADSFAAARSPRGKAASPDVERIAARTWNRTGRGRRANARAS